MTDKHKLFQYCHIQKKVVPIEEAQLNKLNKAINYFIQDEMEPTRNPLNPKEIYTSKSKLRAAYKSAGVIEVGDAYERGYIPDRESGASERKLINNIKTQFVERLRYGR